MTGEAEINPAEIKVKPAAAPSSPSNDDVRFSESSEL